MYVEKKSPGLGIWLSWHRKSQVLREYVLQLLLINLLLAENAPAQKSIFIVGKTPNVSSHKRLPWCAIQAPIRSYANACWCGSHYATARSRVKHITPYPRREQTPF